MHSKKRESDTSMKFVGTGDFCQITTNYTKIDYNPGTIIYTYQVNFIPEVETRSEREKYLKEHIDTVGHIWTYDCQILMLPIKLGDAVTTLTSSSSDVKITLTLKETMNIGAGKEFWSVLMDFIGKELNFKKIKGNYFNSSDPVPFPGCKVESWPGFKASIGKREGGLMLCLDLEELVLSTEPVTEGIEDIEDQNPVNFKSKVRKLLIGRDVVTKPDNTAHRITDIAFALHQTSEELEPAKFVMIKKSQDTTFFIQPENCFLIKSDNRRQNLHPQKLFDSIKIFIQRANSNQNIKTVFDSWDLKLEMEPVSLTGRMLEEETIFFGKDETVKVGPSAHFNRDHPVLEPINIRNWLLVYSESIATEGEFFLRQYLAIATSMGIHVNPAPIIEILKDDETNSYIEGLKKSLVKPNIQLAVIILPTDASDRYSSVKKYLCSENPVLSQVVNAKTLKNKTKFEDTMRKLAQQINCKLGGALWKLKFPIDNWMVFAIHTSNNLGDNPIYATVASSNSTVTKWFSQAIIQNTEEKLENALSLCLLSALMDYKAKNGQYPGRLILFRDRTQMMDEQLQMLQADDLAQIMKACQTLDAAFNPDVTYVAMKRASNLRLMAEWGDRKSNSRPGCVANNTITGDFIHEYFLLSSNVQEGLASPTNYAVLHNTGMLDFGILESVTYKLCFLNCKHAGSIRVPACCHYAEKLSKFVETIIKCEPSEKLRDKLFYL